METTLNCTLYSIIKNTYDCVTVFALHVMINKTYYKYEQFVFSPFLTKKLSEFEGLRSFCPSREHAHCTMGNGHVYCSVFVYNAKVLILPPT